jgi:hypothetical protein
VGARAAAQASRELAPPLKALFIEKSNKNSPATPPLNSVHGVIKGCGSCLLVGQGTDVDLLPVVPPCDLRWQQALDLVHGRSILWRLQSGFLLWTTPTIENGSSGLLHISFELGDNGYSSDGNLFQRICFHWGACILYNLLKLSILGDKCSMYSIFLLVIFSVMSIFRNNVEKHMI